MNTSRHVTINLMADRNRREHWARINHEKLAVQFNFSQSDNMIKWQKTRITLWQINNLQYKSFMSEYFLSCRVAFKKAV